MITFPTKLLKLYKQGESAQMPASPYYKVVQVASLPSKLDIFHEPKVANAA